LLLSFSIVSLSGCAFFGSTTYRPNPLTVLPDRVHLRNVPFHAQAALQCGPAALAMALGYSGRDVQPEMLAQQVYTPGRKGSLQSAVIGATRRNARLAYPIQGLDCLLAALAAGRPVIVLQNLGLSWIPRWHYAVAVGYDLNEQQIILHTGDMRDRRVGLAIFTRTWRRADQWGLQVLVPGEMPACSEESAYLQAALGLQQAGQTDAALAAFSAGAEHWPGSSAAQMAFGNALYAGGDFSGAIRAFEQAGQRAPADGAAFNNLAHVLAETGALEAAESAAQHAVDLGGPHHAIYRQTLEEIRQRRQGRQ